jgi:hypothetical protein
MIRVASPIAEPATFDAECRQQGRAWLATHPNPARRPHDYWSPFREDLREGFGRRCGYLAMFLPDGTVDHFISWDTCKVTNRARLAYEWSNFRFVAPALNSKKGVLDDRILDPFEVQDDWFEVEIPSLVLRMTDAIPPALRDKAKLTLDKLGLEQGRNAVLLRWEWYEKYRRGGEPMQELELDAPLVARAIQRWEQANNGPLPDIPRPVRSFA